jgi:hypothetical protein|tara:strand:+ start:6591 stop:7391 length:801 start_codon:yes stop_codon:yes gene_type:complete
MAKRGQKKVDLGQVINSAVSEGIEAIIESHPRFTDQGEFLASHIDRRKLSQYVGEAVEVIQGYDNPKDQSEALKELYEDTASYVASGEFFTKRGKEAVLRNSFENDSRRLLRGRGSREILEGEKYLDKVMGSFRELYNLFKSGDYAQRMPELSSAVATVYDMGFTDAAVNILYETGMMSKRGYKTFKKAIKERTKESVEFTQEALTKYLIPQKAAASVLGVIGLGVLFSANSITGNIIGTSSSTNIGAMIFGVAVLGVSIWMFFRK